MAVLRWGSGGGREVRLGCCCGGLHWAFYRERPRSASLLPGTRGAGRLQSPALPGNTKSWAQNILLHLHNFLLLLLPLLLCPLSPCPLPLLSGLAIPVA